MSCTHVTEKVHKIIPTVPSSLSVLHLYYVLFAFLYLILFHFMHNKLYTYNFVSDHPRKQLSKYNANHALNYRLIMYVPTGCFTKTQLEL